MAKKEKKDEKKEESKSEKKRTESLKKESGNIYADSKKQSEYDKLRKEGKTDHQARKIVSLKHKK